MKFSQLHLPDSILSALDKMQFTSPTPIQEKSIPVALKGQDILGSAQTGTGKTAAFSIPLLTHLINNPKSKAVVLMPTRELATQVVTAMRDLLADTPDIKLACLIGGEMMSKQFKQLSQNPRIVIGTPGRINDHLLRKTVHLGHTDFVVLDETDRMLDMGFSIQIEKILKRTKKERQTLMFSATIPQHIETLSDKYLKSPARIAVGQESKPAENVQQELIKTTSGKKYNDLRDTLHENPGTVIIFVKTKRGADRLAERLKKDDYSAEAIHGDLRQSKRDKVLRRFREKKCRILVATDVAARGLDIPHIELVVNYDLPQCPEDYIHRIGRTARAGAKGLAVNLLSPEDSKKWHAIHHMLHPHEKAESGDTGRAGQGRGNGKKRFKKKSSSPRNGAPSSRGGRFSKDQDDKRQGRAQKPHRGKAAPDKDKGRSGDWKKKKHSNNNSDVHSGAEFSAAKPKEQKKGARPEKRKAQESGAAPFKKHKKADHAQSRDGARGDKKTSTYKNKNKKPSHHKKRDDFDGTAKKKAKPNRKHNEAEGSQKPKQNKKRSEANKGKARADQGKKKRPGKIVHNDMDAPKRRKRKS